MRLYLPWTKEQLYQKYHQILPHKKTWATIKLLFVFLHSSSVWLLQGILWHFVLEKQIQRNKQSGLLIISDCCSVSVLPLLPLLNVFIELMRSSLDENIFQNKTFLNKTTLFSWWNLAWWIKVWPEENLHINFLLTLVILP